MDYLIIAVVCFAGGAFSTLIALNVMRRRIDELRKQQERETRDNLERIKEIQNQSQRVSQDAAILADARKEIDSRVIAYNELENENALLKRSEEHTSELQSR